MARKRPVVLSPEELIAIRERKAAGQAPVSPVQVLALTNQVARLEADLQAANLKLETRNSLPAEIRKSLDRLLETYDVEPAEELIRLAVERKPGTEPGTVGDFVLDRMSRERIWTTLLQYRMPKLKSVENTGTVKHELNIKVVMLDEREEEKIIETKVMAIAND